MYARRKNSILKWTLEGKYYLRKLPNPHEECKKT